MINQNIKAIILAGSRDFGRCPLASRLPIALWPVAGRPAIEHLLRHLSHQGIKQVTVCSNGDALLLKKSIATVNSMQLKFLEEPLPVGAAGCVRDASNGDKDKLFLVFPGTILTSPDIDTLIQAHRAGKSDLTVMLEPELENGGSGNRSTGIYICEASALEYIPGEGYCDIKEGLIPAMLRAGKAIHTATLKQPLASFRNRVEYLSAIANYLQNCCDSDIGLQRRKLNGSENIWLDDTTKVDPSARIYGPVVIMDKATISKEAVIFGPTIIGSGASIGNNSLIENSVLWDSAKVGENCEIRRCVIDYQAVVRNHTIVEEKSIPCKPDGILKSSVSNVLNVVKNNADKFQQVLQPQLKKVNEKLPNWAKSPKINIWPWFAGGLVLIAFLWSYWPNLVDLWNIWQRSDEYSSGLLVPFLAVYILWSRRHDLVKCRLRPSVWGLFGFLGAQTFRLSGQFFMYGSAERLSIVLSIAALVLMLLGWQIFRKVFSILVFLGLMFPLPRSVHYAIMLPLQSWATSSSVFCLEVLGYNVIREGNIIHLNGTTVAVAEACNGLRMIMAFFMIGGLVVLLIRRTWWEKVIVLASSLPIALFCNSARLTITAIAFTKLSGEYWEKIFHDFGGYAMMPLALGAIVLELWLLTRIATVHIET
ncbi:MAG: exosortase [Planctomycetes bacterium]|nr:exosortase [Planctomycetota bacterium]